MTERRGAWGPPWPASGAEAEPLWLELGHVAVTCVLVMHIELGPWRSRAPSRRRPHGIAQWLKVVGILAIRVINPVELPEHLDEVGLAAQEQPRRQSEGAPER